MFTSQLQYIVLVCESAMRIKISLLEQSGDICHQARWLAKFFQINKVFSNINGMLGRNQNLIHQCRYLNGLSKVIAGSFIRYFCLNQKSLYGNQKLLLVAIMCHTIRLPIEMKKRITQCKISIAYITTAVYRARV